MVTESELSQARHIVAKILEKCNNDRDAAIRCIEDVCKEDKALHELFAKVGYELYGAKSAVKH